MTPKEQINDAIKIAQQRLHSVFSEFEESTGYKITDLKIIRSEGFGKSDGKLLGIILKHETIIPL